MKFFNVHTVDEVKQIISGNFKNYIFEDEEVDILQSIGRIIAFDIISDVDVPYFNRSTVDGYAVKSSDTVGSSDTMPSFMEIKGEVIMGLNKSCTIKEGHAVYVPTGGVVPEGADSVVMVEYTEKVQDNTIMVHKPAAPGGNIVYTGDDIKSGTSVFRKGTKITPLHIGILSAIGHSKIKVFKKPKFSIISTGDEIIDINNIPHDGQIRDINSYTIAALVNELGGEITYKTCVKDDFEKIRIVVKHGLDNSDIILISGGSSVGTMDYTVDVINSFDDSGVLVHGISIKPGKPTIFGKCEGKPVFGLPGHPASAIFIFKVFVEHLFNTVLSVHSIQRVTHAILSENLHSSPGKETYQLVRVEKSSKLLYAVPLRGKSSYISQIGTADGYIVMESDVEGLNQGEMVEVKYF